MGTVLRKRREGWQYYVSLGYQFGLDKPNPAVKSYIDVQKQ